MLRVAAFALTVGVLGAPAGALAQPGGSTWDGSEPIPYFIAEGSTAAGSRPGDRELAEWALGAWARQTDPPLQLVAGPEASALIRIYWVPAGAGLYGEMRARVVDGRRIADVFILPDTNALGPDIGGIAAQDPLFRDTIVFLTCVHELGHAFGLSHTAAFADIMYSFQYGGDFVRYFGRFRDRLATRDDIERVSPFSAADAEAFRSLYPARGGDR